MAVKLRLMRMGKKKQPTYRVVAADSRSPRNGRFIEILGTYAPRSEPSDFAINRDKVTSWLVKGAQPTETVKKLLEIEGVWAEFAATKTVKPSTRTRPTKAAAKKAPAKKAPAKKVAAKAAAPAADETTADAE